jgi:hypothetical protein
VLCHDPHQIDGVVARLIDPALPEPHRFMPATRGAILNRFVKRPLRSIRAGWLGRAGDPAAEPRER